MDFLDKKMEVNEGEVPQYYIEQSHQPINDPEKFNKVQAAFVLSEYEGEITKMEGYLHRGTRTPPALTGWRGFALHTVKINGML